MSEQNRESRSKRRHAKKKKMRMQLIIAGSILLLFVSVFSYLLFGSNTQSFEKEKYFYIHSNDGYDDVLQRLEKEHLVKSISTFRFFASLVQYKDHVRAGKYIIDHGMSNFQLVRMLRQGNQVTVNLVINKLRTENDLYRFLSQNLEPDSTDFRKLLDDTVFAKQIGTIKDCGVCIIIPDTYEFWWNTSVEKTLSRLADYYHQFWNEDRTTKAEAKGFSPLEIMILASIVEEETNYNPEKSLIASVYINRLKKGMRLQADPTAKYAIGDFSIKRITSEITDFASPYNTYYVTGLPPTPICTPSQTSIDAVLNADSTSYLYFCAKEDFSGKHNFAETYEAHQHNATLYQQALNARGIH